MEKETTKRNSKRPPKYGKTKEAQVTLRLSSLAKDWLKNEGGADSLLCSGGGN